MNAPRSAASCLCTMLTWDSEFFGRTIARFEGACYTPEDADATRRFCAEHGVDCVYILLDATDRVSIAAAQEIGATFVDVRMTLETPQASTSDAQGSELPGEIRPATEDDLPAMRRLAATCHRHSRFYADARFDADRVDLLYQTWIEKSCCGDADAVFVIDAAGEAVGYVTCHLEHGGTGQIGLIAVRPDLRGHGVGLRLLRAAGCWFNGAGCRSWRVATQASNVPALRVYQSYGLRTVAVQVWLHLWPAETPRGRL